MTVSQRLRPPHRRRVLGPHSAAHRQHAGTLFSRQIEHHADVAALAHSSDPHHRRGERLVDRQSQRQQQRPGTIIGTHSVAGAGQLTSQQHLCHVMSTRRELVEHLALGQQSGLLEIVERPGNRDLTNHRAPVGGRTRRVLRSVFRVLARNRGHRILGAVMRIQTKPALAKIVAKSSENEHNN
jgi:hypothetical protein